VPPPEAAPAPSAEQAATSKAEAEAEENRRLLALKDAELQTLRQRIAELEKQAGEVAVEEPARPAGQPAPTLEQPAAAPPVAQPAPQASRPAPRPAARPAPAQPAESTGGGVIDTIGSVLTSVWFLVGLGLAGITAWLLVRRRSAADEAVSWRPAPAMGRGARAPQAEADEAGGEDMIVIEEPRRAQATGGFERRAVPREEETPLERTISTEGPVNLDQADPLAEADFHMAYGLYDQAADLLTAALAKEPARRDLHLKLLDVYFVWENREGFLKEARALHERVGAESDPDWKRVVIMGKQLCPTEALFAGDATPAVDEMDLALTADGGGTGSLALGGADQVDFDLSSDMDIEAEPAAGGATKGRPWSSAPTQEVPTIEAPGISSTMETPTIESPAVSTTMETPTIEAPMGDRTLETPTVETTARVRAGDGEERAETTAEIDLEDLGLDLTGLDEAARDMATGIQEALPGDAGGLDFDVSGGALSPEGEESTAEMERSTTLKDLSTANKGDTGDTAEHPAAGDSLITPGLSATSGEIEALDIDLNLGGEDTSQSDLTATGLTSLRGRGPEDATMTEVGTKLDLARAYLDMGDPDGARSILNEVLEEGDPSQRQEARQLLDSLDR
jgi:pilus assembly protein FimV